MSIPPLVCSSPPPPEQCEDDKEPEDYDFQYNSQPDDDEESTSYNYDNFSSNNYFKSETESIQNLKICENITDELNISSSPEAEIKTVNSIPHFTETFEEINSGMHEDCILEDLNLELTTENLHITNDKQIDESNNLNIDSSTTANIQDEGGTEAEVGGIQTKDFKGFSQSSSENEDLQIIDNLSGDITFTDDKQYNEDNMTESNIAIDSEEIRTKDEAPELLEADPNKSTVIDFKIVNEDDDFGDFDSFQYSNTQATSTQSHAILNIENPWENKIDESQEFGDFTANFDNTELTLKTTESHEFKNKTNSNDAGEAAQSDDDFGDFDDFRTSDNKVNISSTSEDVLSCSNVFNLPTTDSEVQVMENINVVLKTIFTEEIVEPDDSVEANLELVLGEIWGHLIDTDTRQPYMVNWNNTLGQKSLLKALCIDSRNILFGTRWNYNMPKFAANLSTSPLQPQKQPTLSNAENNEQVSEKETNAWVDPFTPHGQEYTYAEALLLDLEHLMATLDQMAHKHSTLKISDLLSHACSTESETPVADIKPKILDGFTSEIPTSTKIYSSTLSVQPIRQINLPDTHIFTPTDSETPRSKTIHYDSNPRSLGDNFDTEIIKSHTKSEPGQIDATDTEKENAYWDFQQFKGDTGIPTSATSNEQTSDLKTSGDDTIIHKTELATQILQPIKLKPIVPTLNWPDPGDVKETFYDFSEFVSSTSTNNPLDSTSAGDKETVQDISVKVDSKKLQINVESNDDDFETFQSAPITSQPSEIKSRFETDAQISTPKLDSSPAVVNYEVSKTDIVSDFKTSEALSNTDEFKVNYMHNNHTISSQVMTPVGSQVNALPVLQPSGVNIVRNQQNTGQILQPLTLEGFSQINWPNPGIDLHDLSKFNPIESVHSLKSESSTSGQSKVSPKSTPTHNSTSGGKNNVPDDDWGDFVSSVPKPKAPSPKKTSTFADDDEWTDFVSSPSVKPQNGLNTISFNVHTNLNMQKSSNQMKYSKNKSNQMSLDIPTLNYITPKTGGRGAYADKHFQNL